eukprot:m.451152 g.451152  ORF g.451152 m.451152 type:complete len:468 (+) comp20108_c0_seq1:98-1501(+)
MLPEDRRCRQPCHTTVLVVGAISMSAVIQDIQGQVFDDFCTYMDIVAGAMVDDANAGICHASSTATSCRAVAATSRNNCSTWCGSRGLDGLSPTCSAALDDVVNTCGVGGTFNCGTTGHNVMLCVCSAPQGWVRPPSSSTLCSSVTFASVSGALSPFPDGLSARQSVCLSQSQRSVDACEVQANTVIGSSSTNCASWCAAQSVNGTALECVGAWHPDPDCSRLGSSNCASRSSHRICRCALPTLAPTLQPSAAPVTLAPTAVPTRVPTTVGPTALPTVAPVAAPTAQPSSGAPSFHPTIVQTRAPSTMLSTTAPTAVPTPVGLASSSSGSSTSGSSLPVIVAVVVVVILVAVLSIVSCWRRGSATGKKTSDQVVNPMFGGLPPTNPALAATRDVPKHRRRMGTMELAQSRTAVEYNGYLVPMAKVGENDYDTVPHTYDAAPASGTRLDESLYVAGPKPVVPKSQYEV